jgi:hypothetical protein
MSVDRPEDPAPQQPRVRPSGVVALGGGGCVLRVHTALIPPVQPGGEQAVQLGQRLVPVPPSALRLGSISTRNWSRTVGELTREWTAAEGAIALHLRTNDPGGVRRCVPGLAQKGTGG